MNVIRTTEMLHPLLINAVKNIQSNIINKYNMPISLFETGRLDERHNYLISKGKSRDLISPHQFDIEINPPLYATAVDYVYFNKKWSWNIRDTSILKWYELFGNLVLDLCPELKWGGVSRKSVNYNHFILKEEVVVNNISKYPCVLQLS